MKLARSSYTYFTKLKIIYTYTLHIMHNSDGIDSESAYKYLRI